MAGSLNHIIDSDGTFTMDLIDNLGEAHEALEECFNLIIELSEGNMLLVSRACRACNYPDPYDPDSVSGEDLPGPMRRY